MKRDSRANRVAFRRAVWASAALHAVAVGALVLLLRATQEQPHVQPGIDTHAEPQIRISLGEEASVRLEESTLAKPQVAVPESPPVASPEAPSALPAKPFAPTPPQLLPPEMVALIRKPAAMPASAPSTFRDPNVRPAGAPGTPASSVPAMHGALSPGKCVVYLLDASGSMGASGKFDAARATLVSTLRQQPATVRFQVIIYAGNATRLLTSDAQGLRASEANVRVAAEKLAKIEPRGRSNHLAAVREALAFRPDVLLLLTDAADLSAAALKPVLASAEKPVLVCVGHVTTDGVQRPRPLK